MPDRNLKTEPLEPSINALVVAYYFPPSAGGGVERIHNLVRYLPEFGVAPRVVTVPERFYEGFYSDESLLGEYGSEVKIIRAAPVMEKVFAASRRMATRPKPGGAQESKSRKRLKSFLKGLAIPDEIAPWLPSAITAGSGFAEREGVAAVLSTAPPFTTHVAAAKIARANRLPLILDYRDLWVRNPLYGDNRFRRAIDRSIERYCLRAASTVVVTNEAAKRVMAAEYPFIAQRIEVIENGYNEEKLTECRQPWAPVEAFRFVYTGTLDSQRSPEFFFRALRRVVDDRPTLRVEVHFYGHVHPSFSGIEKEFGLAEMVHFHGSVAKKQALEVTCGGADALLVFQRVAQGGETAIPGKVYEYLASGTPIFAMDESDSITAQFLRQENVEDVYPYTDVDVIQRGLERLLDHYAETRQRAGEIRLRVRRFDRRLQAERFAALIRSACRSMP
jgi:glycosyltransferase involved in cell wall biosynthesis